MADRKITDLSALTSPASGDLLPIVDVSEAANVDKNKSITYSVLFRSLGDGTLGAPSVSFLSDTGTTGIYDQVELGELKVKYNKTSQTSGVINNVFDVYPWLQTYLGPYCMGGAANYAVRLFRG